MSMHRKTITSTDQQAKNRLAVLRQALVEGESSGESKPLDMSSIKAAGHKMSSARTT
ncbi:type II toxin-antitoxin system ParD family antitoxin [Salinispirillum marinum]|uniref:Type II toxin-antitoxin system ParD family antitoxin n=2 Tax=Saccharospirillaceae TaxID=255527 RepID=A0ABV8BH22_9GAMM